MFNYGRQGYVGGFIHTDRYVSFLCLSINVSSLSPKPSGKYVESNNISTLFVRTK